MRVVGVVVADKVETLGPSIDCPRRECWPTGREGSSVRGGSMSGSGERRVREGDLISVEVRGLLPTGEGTAGRLRVPGAFPGELVAARVDHVGKNATFATLREVTKPRQGRRRPPCLRHSDVEGGRCTGCPLMSLEETEQRLLLREMLREQYGLGVGEVIAAPKALGYRRSSKRIAFGGPGNLRLGSFVRGTHQPADMKGCLVDHPLIAAAADEIAAVARQLEIGAHHEQRGQVGLRAVWLRTNGAQVLATLVTSDPEARPLRQLAQELTRCDGIARSFHDGAGNALRGAQAERLRGIDSLEVHGARVGALGFLQPNPEVAEMIYDDLVEGMGAGRVFDLYAGAGATTRRLRALGGEVTACEAHPEGADALGVEPETAEAFLTRQKEGPSSVVANPPRKGLGTQVTEQLLRLQPSRIHIMSCGPAGLARDIAALGQSYRLESLRAYDTLPQTPHVELVAKLVRA